MGEEKNIKGLIFDELESNHSYSVAIKDEIELFGKITTLNLSDDELKKAYSELQDRLKVYISKLEFKV